MNVGLFDEECQEDEGKCHRGAGVNKTQLEPTLFLISLHFSFLRRKKTWMFPSPIRIRQTESMRPYFQQDLCDDKFEKECVYISRL